MLELRIANASDEPIENESSRSRGKRSKKQDRSFFTPVSNSVLTTKELTTKARQILLILELKAGASRIARLSHEEIARLTGYQRQTVKRSLQRLQNQEWISEVEAGAIRLCKPIPADNYVQVYDGVVYHPVWHDWQKHVLLFVMSQFRGRDREFGVSKYSLNLYGRQQPSVEQSCHIPGSTKERRARFREFVEQLQSDRILHVVNSATSNRPAICVVDRDALEQLRPDYDRHTAATFRMTVSGGDTHRHTSRSNTVTRHVAGGHPSRSKTVTRHAATPSSVTYEKDSEDSKDSEKILESPRFACGERGAISSRSKREAPVDDSESGYHASESADGELAAEDSFASLMELPQHRLLTKEIDRRCLGISLCTSRKNPSSLAAQWKLLLEQLPADLHADDVELAIKSENFQGLKSRSWGLLLDDDFIVRFGVEIKKRYEERNRMVRNFQDRYQTLLNDLSSHNAATRVAAIERLASLGGSKPDVALRIALLLSPKQRDSEPKVRFAAVQKLLYLATMKLIPDRCRESIRRVAEKTLLDRDDQIREEAKFLLEELDRHRVAS